ncbi:MAG: DUF1926 domain-containing protein [Treponema sp.]|nr:DUF1926 domain-containing protein [Treponema sp.]
MNSIYVSFNLKSITTNIDFNAKSTNASSRNNGQNTSDSSDKSSISLILENFDKNYHEIYKPLAKFLYFNSNFSFSFTFSGQQLQFLKKRRNEFITICNTLIERNQLEVVSGSGFYDCILPLLYPVDRNGQLDLIIDQIKQTFGKRPRGIALFADCWDSSLLNCLQTSGIEYVFLESSIIPENKQKFLPLIMTDLGKSIEIQPYYDSFIPEPSMSPEEFVQNIISSVAKIKNENIYFQNKPDRIINICLNHEQILPLIKEKWFEKLNHYFQNNPECIVKTITPYNYSKSMNNENPKIPAYIPSGINGSIAKWIGSAFKEANNFHKNNYTVYDFMDTYPQSHSIYDRIMFTSMLVNNYKKDKMRKKDAREKLWQAQNGAGILCTSKGAFSNSNYRQQCYKYLMAAEKIIREGEDFNESITCFDYNGDGVKEYICRMQNYFSYITLKSGAIQELEILKNTGNYVDNLSKVKEYDNCSDDYERGLFIDHLFTQKQFEKYVNGEPAGEGVFSKVQYSELKYKQHQREIQLCAFADFSNSNKSSQRVFLRKKYLINSTGMIVQYILRNESDKPLKAVFAVESNFAHTNFDSENITYYSCEVAQKDEEQIGSKKLTIDTTKSTGEIKNVDIARISDLKNGISFGIEPNETSGFCFTPIIFKRPAFNGQDIIPVHMTSVSTFYWNIDIEPGKETERTLNFTITATKNGMKR